MTPDLHPEPCPSCSAPMATDQRYCLACGARRGEARIDYRPLLQQPAAMPAPAPAPEPSGAPRTSAWSVPAVLATIACLLLAVAIGVLIGRSGDDGRTAAAPPPQVIKVEGAVPAAATTTPAPTDTTATTDAAPSDTKAAKKRKDKADASAGKASSSEVKSLDTTSGEDYVKKSQKLPKEVGTGGKAPPKDNKPAGGGSDFESIG